MPTNKDPDALARKIAVEVGNRRKAGETVTDEDVLRDHPKLRVPLLEQLSRLGRLHTARLRATEPASASDASPEEISTDNQGTLDLPVCTDDEPLLADEVSSEAPVSKNTASKELVSKDKKPVAAAQPIAQPNQATKQASQKKQSSQPLATPKSKQPIEPPLTAEAPPENDYPVDQLRITLKEPSIDVRNQSTMVLDESSESESKQDESKVPRYRPTVRAPMAVVKLFHDGQSTFNHYPILADRFRIGRTEGELIVPHDFWMSGRHAEIQRRKRGESFHWFLVDLNSTNGTFVQADFAVLQHHDELFLGQERYRFLLQDGKAGLMHVTRGSGQQWAITESTAVIGSQAPCGLKSFASDPYLDAVHARLKREPDGTWTIRDNRSRNGLWYRVKEVEIPPNAEFQLGEQRFGFWTHSDRPVKAAHLHIASRMLDSTQ